MDKPKLYSTTEAADHLGIHPQVLRYHIYTKGHLKADYTIGGDLVFLQSTLDDFKAKHQSEGLTMQEAADVLGVQRHWVRNQFHAGRLTPIGKRGKFWIFDPDSIESLRRQLEGRTTAEEATNG